MSTPTIDDLRERVRAQVITPGDPAFDDARRVHNGMFDRRPGAVVRAEQTADVMAAVEFARDTGLPLAVRGGGHSAPGYGTVDDGLVIDLSPMRHVHVDPNRGTARVGGGATWGDVNYATHAYGLATPGGIVSTTGVGGLTLGGGIGYLSRGYGLSVDNLVSADVVTADGRVRTASRHENPDLFWGLRGGGGNFGVVTSFEFALHPVKDVYVGLFLYELAAAGDLLRFFREFIADAPGEYGGYPRLPGRPAAGVHPRRSPWGPVGHGRRALVRAGGAGRAGDAALPRCRPGRGRDGWADALPGAERRVRRDLPEGTAQLLEGPVRHRAHRCGYRGAPAARPGRA